jgi:hypothetical protein
LRKDIELYQVGKCSGIGFPKWESGKNRIGAQKRGYSAERVASMKTIVMPPCKRNHLPFKFIFSILFSEKRFHIIQTPKVVIKVIVASPDKKTCRKVGNRITRFPVPALIGVYTPIVHIMHKTLMDFKTDFFSLFS